MLKCSSAKLAVAVLASLLSASQALSDARGNPFVAPPSEQELQARMDERMRNIILEVQPEIRANIMQDVHAAQATLEIRIRRRIDEAVRNASLAAAAAPQQQPSIIDGLIGAATPEQKVPEGATFISCINGKALYRDRENVMFQTEGDGVQGSDRCAR